MTDLLLTDAHVLTMDPERPHAGAISVAGGRIVAVHGALSPRAARDLGAREIRSLDGLTVTPGFHDAHNHMAWYGLGLLEVDLSTPPVQSLDDLYAAVRARAVTLGPDEWVVGSGYDQNKIGGHPEREALERAARGRKVWLKHTSGHMCMVSSAVLDELGIADLPREVDGGVVSVDADGRPTGLLQERAQTLVADLVMPYPLSALEDAIESAGRRYLTEGITSATEAGIGGGWIGKSPVELAAYQNAYAAARLPVRVDLMIAHDALHSLSAHEDDAMTLGLDLGIRTGFGDDRLRIGPTKFFTDGSLIGRTSAMCCDFADEPGNKGYLQDDADAMRSRIIEAHRSGWRVAAHAIGDAAVELVLDAYEQAQREFPRPDVRHRIEHFGVAGPEQVERTARLGVVPVPQGRFVNEIGDGMIAALGPGRTRWAYRHRSLLDAGIVVPGSSDRPVVQGAPLLGMHDLVNQRTGSGAPFNPDEAVTAEEALRAFTVGSAYASKAEHVKGSVTVGSLADLVVLDQDPTTVEPAGIADTGVVATYLDGRCVHDGGGRR